MYYSGSSTDFDAAERHMKAYSLIKKYMHQLDDYSVALRQFEAAQPLLKQNYGERYIGLETNWQDISGGL